jgi:glycosyltransferase involved in cell wall biosynthesis
MDERPRDGARLRLAVPPDDPEAFADAVERLRERRGELERMGRAGRQLAESRFSQQKILVDLARFVEETGASASPRRAVAETAGDGPR